jgi:hypothetical protein
VVWQRIEVHIEDVRSKFAPRNSVTFGTNKAPRQEFSENGAVRAVEVIAEASPEHEKFGYFGAFETSECWHERPSHSQKLLAALGAQIFKFQSANRGIVNYALGPRQRKNEGFSR